MLRSALGAKPTENEFAFSNHPLPQRARRGRGNVEPIDILDTAATVADEVVVEQAFSFEPRPPALYGNFAD